jgi:soluble lytic murein transglycosylase-like protein
MIRYFNISYHAVCAFLWVSIFTIVMHSVVVPAKPEETQVSKNMVENRALSKTSDDLPHSIPDLEAKARGKKRQIEKEAYHGIISAISIRHNVDPTLIKAIIMAESSYNPNAISKKGAKGLMQLMPQTAKALGVEDSFDPVENIKAGVRYFERLQNNFNGDTSLSLAAYHAGISRVRKYNGVPPFKSTRKYIKKVLSYQQSLKNHEHIEKGGGWQRQKVVEHP